MKAAEEGTRQRGTRYDQTGRCQEWEPGEQEEVAEMGQLEVGIAGQAGPGFLGLAGFCHAQRDFLGGDDLPVDHHPVVIVMTFWYVFIGTDLLFSNFLNFYSSFGIDHDPHVHMTYVHTTHAFLMFHSSHDYTAKRSCYRIMIFSTTLGVLFYGRILTLIFFYFLHNPTTPILPVYVYQRRPDLEKDTTRPRSVIIREIATVPGRTLIAPD